MAVPIGTEELAFRAAQELDMCGIPPSERARKIQSARRLAIERPQDLAPYIEHTALKPETTRRAVITHCEEAKRFGFRGVCVNPMFVEEAKRQLAGSMCMVVTVVGFPLGANLPDTKAEETKSVVSKGADEVDMVIPVGALKAGEYPAVFDHVKAVVRAAGVAIPVKVILETALLDEYQKVLGCLLAERAGAAFVKTSTGFALVRKPGTFASGGATVEDVSLMRKVVGDRIGIKAAGGITDFLTAREMIAAGADRIGCSASVAIVS